MTTFRRADWGAQPLEPGGAVLAGPLPDVFIHHTAGATPSTVDGAMAEIRRVQAQHIQSNGWQDIGYSWLVDDAGNAYEGRGWLRSGAHTEGHNSTAHGICWLGNSMVRRPSTSALACIAQLITDGVKARAVDPQPNIYGHRDANQTACPGDQLYESLTVIRQALLDFHPQSTNPSGEEDDLTPEDKAWLDGKFKETNANTSVNASYLGQWAQGLAGEHRQILDRLGALEAGQIPSAAEIAAELLRQMGIKP